MDSHNYYITDKKTVPPLESSCAEEARLFSGLQRGGRDHLNKANHYFSNSSIDAKAGRFKKKSRGLPVFRSFPVKAFFMAWTAQLSFCMALLAQMLQLMFPNCLI